MPSDAPKATRFVARGAAGYDAYMGRWSRRLAPLFLDFAGVEAGERVVDIGCGTGNLAFALAKRSEVAAIEAIDYEEQFIAAMRQRSTDPRITMQQGDACALPFPSARFDRALSMLVFHFVGDADRAAAEMRRVLRPGGGVAAAVWDTYGGMPSQRLFWDTLAAIEPTAVPPRAASMMRPTTQPDELKGIFARAGFVDIAETMLTIRMDFANFDDYWHPLISGQGTLEPFLSGLRSERRDQIHAAVRAAFLCARPDGPRSFASVAWAVKGVAPGNA